MSSNGVVVVVAVGVGVVLVGEGADVAVRVVDCTVEGVETGCGRDVARAGATAARVARGAVGEVLGALVDDGVGAAVVLGEVAAVSTSGWAVSPGRSGSTNPNATRAVSPPTHSSSTPGSGFQLACRDPSPWRAISRR